MMSEKYFSDRGSKFPPCLVWVSGIRVIVLFTDIGSSWFEDFILDCAFLRFVRKISSYISITYANIHLT